MWGALSSRQDGSVVYNCCWLSPAQPFSDPSPMGLATIFYCLRFETSFFVASYDSRASTRDTDHAAQNTQPLYCCRGVLPRSCLAESQRGPHRKHLSFLSLIVIAACSLVRYPAVSVLYCRVLLYALPSNGLFVKNISQRECVYRAVA
jgi:hypothetical protein